MKKPILLVQIIAILIFITNIKLIFAQDYPWSGHPKVPIITAKDVKTRILSGDKCVFVDAQNRDEFNKHHICGAIYLPPAWLPPHPYTQKLREIPKSYLILGY
jgi:hypothetical protein